MTSTGFLDTHEQAVAVSLLHSSPDVEAFLWGGFDDAERRILVCLPKGYADYISEDAGYADLLMVLHVDCPAGAKALSHRDYLGSVLGLGIERRMIGDILVQDNCADIICLSDISEYLGNELFKVGRIEVKTSVRSLSELSLPEKRVRLIRDTVPSPRLDNIVSAAFSLSRSLAADGIKAGLVAVDHVECTKPDRKLEEGSIITFKGKGKAALSSLGGVSKKGRIWIEIERYI